MTQLILVGGFLGAGKTTMLHQAAQKISATGKKVGLITNDQATDLVDTFLLSDTGIPTKEVSGSCFCCNFPGFFAAVESLQKSGAEVIIAEPVGSCTDLVATIVQPVKKFHVEIQLSRFSVLLDPVMLQEVLGLKETILEKDGAYIVLKQMEEADILAINKSDTLSEEEQKALLAAVEARFPGKPVLTISGKTGAGVDAWLELVGDTSADVGTAKIDVDYDRYAHGEAILGWMNCSATPAWKRSADVPGFLSALFAAIQKKLKAENIAVGHLKATLYDSTVCGFVNLTHLDAEPAVWTRSVPAHAPLLILNVRIQTSPEHLEKLVREALETDCAEIAEVKILEFRCFQPGRPNPTYRVKQSEYV